MSKIKIFLIFSFAILFFAVIFYFNSLYFKLGKFLNNKNAQIGIAVIKDDKFFSIGNQKMPLLSVFKYCVAIKVLKKLENENISLNDTITIEKNMVDETLYSPMLKKYPTFPFKISIGELLEYMISKSDNNACDILINYCDGISALNDFIKSMGFKDIEILFNEKEMNEDIKKQYLNKAYPMDIAKLMKFVREGELLSYSSKAFLDEIMIKTETGKDKLKSGLPENTIIAHKTGYSLRTPEGLKIADNDAGYVILPDGSVYYITVMIKNSKMSDKENSKTISKISKTVYEYFLNKKEL